ncbi:MAG: metal-dependent hydrolase [Pseudomonadota bacterium]
MIFTWYGHAAFRLEFDGATLLFDPFLSGNPTWDGGWEAPAEGVSHILLTHGHDDHLGDTLEIAKTSGATVVGSFEVCQWAARNGIAKIEPGNHGGTIDCGAFTVTFVNALHSSARMTDHGAEYLGNPLGLIVTPKSGEPSVYHMGDTGIFGDMALINTLYAPKVGLVPVGDRFTMGAREASYACRHFFDFSTIVPCHYGTFPPLDQTPDAFLAAMEEDADKVTVAERGVPFAV